jgi:hypothetical protein
VFLPPPPPYRAGTTGSDGLSESASTPKLITLSAGAIRVGGGQLPAELCPVINANNVDSFPQLVAYHQQQFNGHISQQSSEFPNDFRRINPQSPHRIHRSLSDSKYGQNEPSRRLLKSDSQNSAIISTMNSLGALTDNNPVNGPFLQHSTKIGNSDPYVVGTRGSSYTNSQMSLVSDCVIFNANN